MLYNPNIAVCVGNFYFTGKAKPLGSAFDDRNAKIKASYMLRYPESFSEEDEFIESDEVFLNYQLKMCLNGSMKIISPLDLHNNQRWKNRRSCDYEYDRQ